MEKQNILDDISEIFVLNGFPGQMEYKGFSLMRIDIGRRVPEPLGVLDMINLFHGLKNKLIVVKTA